MEFDESKYFHVIFGYELLMEHIKTNKDIPAALLNDFVSLFDIIDPQEEIENNKEVIIEKCYQYLKDCNYDFNIKISYPVPPEFPPNLLMENGTLSISSTTHKIGPPPLPSEQNRTTSKSKKQSRIYERLTLRDLLDSCLYGITNKKIYRVLNNKPEAIKMIIEEVNEFNKKLGKKKLNTYKTYVITGIISSSIGVIDSKEKYKEIHKKTSGYNKFLFEQVRNSLKKKFLPTNTLTS